MKYVHQLGFLDTLITKSEAEELMRIKPEARHNKSFGCSLETQYPDGDEFIQRALEMLKRHGIPLRYSVNSSGYNSSYGYTISRFYEPDDLKNAELLLFVRQRRIHDTQEPARDGNGRLFLVASKAKENLKFGSLWWPDWVIISNQVRRSLESAGLVGLRFIEVAIKGKSCHLAPEPFWELQSSITLPKMPNHGNFIHPVFYPDHPTVEPFQGDYSRPIYINDEPFTKGELHYRRSDLVALGQFDIAATFENYMEEHPVLVVSQRFYQHCRQHKIPLAVEPVRIDPD